MKNYYRECRERAGLSQEQAMELLDIGIRSLTDFESGKAIPPDRVAERMVEVYHSKTLGLVHLRNRYDIAMQCIPESFIAEMEAEEKKEGTTMKTETTKEETSVKEKEEQKVTKFEVGKKYYCHSIADSDCIFEFEVVKRTEKTVTIKDSFGKEKRRNIKLSDGEEYIYPLGKYSMSPTLRSSKEIKETVEETTQMKVTSNKEQKIKEYLKNKINDSWYYHAKMDYGVDGEFIDAKIKGSNLIIVWREEENVYTGVIGYYEDYNCEQLYDIWSEGNINIIECIQSNPKKEEKEKVEVVGNVIYCDFGRAV